MTLFDFSNAIAGSWFNPVTKNHFLFVPDKTDISNGKFSILQHGAAIAIVLHTCLTVDNGKMLAVVEQEAYEIFFAGAHIQSMHIVAGQGSVIRLIKK